MPAPVVSAPRPVPERGKVALQIIADPNAHPPKLADRQEFVAPHIMGEPLLPVYPPEALEGHAAPATVVLRITIDTHGRVSHIEDSPVLASTAGPFAEEFRWAAIRAMRRWRFTPGYFDQVEDGEDLDGDGKPDFTRSVQIDYVDVFYDLRFDFEIVRGEGRVHSSMGAPPPEETPQP